MSYTATRSPVSINLADCRSLLERSMSNKQLGALASVEVFSLLLLLVTFPATAQNHTTKAITFNSALLVLNKAENTLAILNTQTLAIIGRVPVGEGPHEVI